MESSDDEILDYIVQELTNEIGIRNIAYKGGYILNKLIPDSRKTYDVDFSIAKRELYEDVKELLKEIGEEFISYKLISSYEIKDDVTKNSSGGIKLCRNEKSHLGVDVGLHPLGYGIKEMKLVFADIRRFTIERSLADKLSAICSPKRFRRVKDLYDTYMFISLFNIDGRLLTECKDYRSIDYTKMPDDEIVITQLKYAYSKLSLGSKDKDELKPLFNEVYNLVLKFIVGSQDCSDKMWNHEKGAWL